MQVFVIFATSQPIQIAAALAAKFPADHLSLGQGTWFVAADGLTSRDVGDAIGVSEGENGNGIISPVETYWGRAPSNVWEWVGARRARAAG